MDIIQKSLESEKYFQKKDLPILEKIAALLFSKKFKKKEIILREGQVCKEIFYVKKGLLRVYIINDGKEVNTWFVKEGDFITSIGSFHYQLPSDHYIDAVEDCEIISIKKSTLEFIVRNNHKAALFAMNELFKKLCDYQDQASALRFMNAENRYHYLYKKNNDVLSRLSQKHIASFIGVDEAYLSKVIKNQSQDK
jgi:CRP-like cAMP-binding protein